MDFAFSEEQEQLRSVARDFLADAYPMDAVARIADSPRGWDPTGWTAIAGLGWLDAELGPLEHAVLLEEAAAALLPAPLFSSLALALPGVGGDESLAAEIANGRRRLTFAWVEDGQSQDLRAAGRTSSATLDEKGRVTGRKVLVPDAAIVDGFVVPVRTPDDEIALCLVTVGDGVSVRTVPTIDSTRRFGTVQFDMCPALQLASGADATFRLQRIAQHALVGAACEAVGVARRALGIAVEHARVREQFGRPIGSYQAISHRIADVYVRVQLAGALATWAAWTLTESSPEGSAQGSAEGSAESTAEGGFEGGSAGGSASGSASGSAGGSASGSAGGSAGGFEGSVQREVVGASMSSAAAKSYATETAVLACESAIQVLGGIGFTWDHPVHRYYKRAQWLDAFGGGGSRHRAVIAAALLD